MMGNWTKKLPALAGPTVFVGLIVAQVLGWYLPLDYRWSAYVTASALTTLILSAGIFVGVGGLRWTNVRVCWSPVFLTISVAAWLALVETLPGKLAVILTASLLVGSYQSHLLAGENAVQPGFRTAATPAGPSALAARPGLPQAGFITDLFAAFFFTAFVFGLDSFYDVPLPASAMATGFLWAVLAHESLWRFGAEKSDRRLLGLAFGVVGAEIHVGLSFLPVGYLTDTAVAVLTLAFGLDLARRTIFNAVSVRQFREGSLAALSLIVILLLTAKWN